MRIYQAGVIGICFGGLCMLVAGAVCASGDADCSEGGGFAMIVLALLQGLLTAWYFHSKYPEQQPVGKSTNNEKTCICSVAL